MKIQAFIVVGAHQGEITRVFGPWKTNAQAQIYADYLRRGGYNWNKKNLVVRRVEMEVPNA